MHQRRLQIALALSILVLTVTPAAAIQNGTHDGTGHPAVAWIIETTGPNICNLGASFVGNTSVLVSDSVLVLTGDWASVLQGGLGGQFDNIWVNFDGDAPLDCTKYEHVASVHVHPGYNPSTPEVDNLGALVLDAPASVAPATLPVLGRLNGLPTTQAYTAVADGTDKGSTIATIARRAEASSFRSLGPNIVDLRIDRNGPEPPCFGELADGGAAYVGSTTEIVGMLVNANAGGCSKVGNFLRLDTASARSFMGSLGVPLP